MIGSAWEELNNRHYGHCMWRRYNLVARRAEPPVVNGPTRNAGDRRAPRRRTPDAPSGNAAHRRYCPDCRRGRPIRSGTSCPPGILSTAWKVRINQQFA